MSGKKNIAEATGIPRIQRSLYFPVELLDTISEEAKRERRSFNQQVIYMLENLIDQKAS